MAPVKNEEDEMNENVPKMLCHMDNHLGKMVKKSGEGALEKMIQRQSFNIFLGVKCNQTKADEQYLHVPE